jgi:hypothetical protein
VTDIVGFDWITEQMVHGDGDAVGGATKSSGRKYDLMDCMLCSCKDVLVVRRRGEGGVGMVRGKEKVLEVQLSKSQK